MRNSRLLFSDQPTSEHVSFSATDQTIPEICDELKLYDAQALAHEADIVMDEIATTTGEASIVTIESIEHLLFNDDEVDAIEYASARMVVESMSQITGRPVVLSEFTIESYDDDSETLIQELQNTTEGFLGDLKAGIARVSRRIYRSSAAFMTVLMNRQGSIAKLAAKLEEQMAKTTEGNVIGATIKNPSISRWFTSPEDAVAKLQTYADFRKEFGNMQGKLKGVVESTSIDDYAKGIEDVMSPLAKIGGVSGADVQAGITTISLPAPGGGLAVFTAGLATTAAISSGAVYGVKNVKFLGKQYKEGAKAVTKYKKLGLKKVKGNKLGKKALKKVSAYKRARTIKGVKAAASSAPSKAAKAISSKFGAITKSIKEAAAVRSIPGFKVGKGTKAWLNVKRSATVRGIWAKTAYLKNAKTFLAANIPGMVGFLVLEYMVTKAAGWAMAKRLPALEYAQISEILSAVQDMASVKMSLSGIAGASAAIEKAALDIDASDPGALKRGNQSIKAIMAFTSMVNKMGRTVYANSVDITRSGVAYATKSLKVHAKTSATTEGLTTEASEWIDALDTITETLESVDFVEDSIDAIDEEQFGGLVISDGVDESDLTGESVASEFMFDDVDDVITLVDSSDEEFEEFEELDELDELDD